VRPQRWAVKDPGDITDARPLALVASAGAVGPDGSRPGPPGAVRTAGGASAAHSAIGQGTSRRPVPRRRRARGRRRGDGGGPWPGADRQPQARQEGSRNTPEACRRPAVINPDGGRRGRVPRRAGRRRRLRGGHTAPGTVRMRDGSGLAASAWTFRSPHRVSTHCA
jgi:hypothetical protein